MKDAQPKTEWGEQDENGVDVARLRYNLTLTNEQRVEQHQKAARFVLECMSAAERSRVSRPTEST